ncbi:MAG: RusA family crossover junction endodeoxyribonuclease [Lysobacter sp.]|nr:RusA family crossover junction endodeoxyribonuclease [Lysobacter sp.]
MDDELIEAIDKANAGLSPSPFGKMQIVVSGAPASVQASKAVRDSYLSAIKDKLADYQFILTGQLFLEITWLVPAKSRYETDAKADIDNCLKPIIDAFTGPAGLFINDCQLKGLYICWRHTDADEEELLFQFEFDPDHWCERKGLAFLRLERGLCSPVSTLWPQSLRKDWAELMRTGEAFKAKFETMGVSYLAVAGMTGGGQPFHITRTAGFPVLSADEFVGGGAA